MSHTKEIEKGIKMLEKMREPSMREQVLLLEAYSTYEILKGRKKDSILPI